MQEGVSLNTLETTYKFDSNKKLEYVDNERELTLSKNLHLVNKEELFLYHISENDFKYYRGKYKKISCLEYVNNARYLNKFFEFINSQLPDNGEFTVHVQLKEQKEKKILQKKLFGLQYLFYTIHFITHRVIPKLPYIKKLYFDFTKGKNRIISKAELLGRLISCGFNVVQIKNFNDYSVINTVKEKEPFYAENPTYGPIVGLKRIGKNGKIINVYKLRTMHPFSEFLQSYIYDENNLDNGGKFKDDFRVTKWGSWMRKVWIDEIPMIYNLLKGDLKLVGVRPISEHYHSLYPRQFVEQRDTHKPGLIPPFYVDLPQTFEQIVESEKRYLEKYVESPLKTDITYLFKAIWNIIKGARSK